MSPHYPRSICMSYEEATELEAAAEENASLKANCAALQAQLASAIVLINRAEDALLDPDDHSQIQDVLNDIYDFCEHRQQGTSA